MGQHVSARRVHPDEERLAVLLRLVHESNRRGRYHLVESRHVILDTWHRTGRQRSLIDDLLPADLAPTRFHCRVVHVCRPAMDQLARADPGFPLWGVSVVEWI